MRKFDHIELKMQNKRAVIWLNRPEVHNAISPAMTEELNMALGMLENQPQVSLLVIRGKGKSFSSGADLRNMYDMSKRNFEDNLEDARRLAQLFERIFRYPKPVIALLHGNVYGGANGIMAAADIVLAARDTAFRFSEVHLGLVAAIISPYILMKAGFSRTKELMLTGRAFDAREALEYSLIHFITESREMEAKLDEICRNVERGGPSAEEKTKRLLSESMYKQPGPDLREFTSELLAGARSSEEGREGLAAFFEKRLPYWLNS